MSDIRDETRYGGSICPAHNTPFDLICSLCCAAEERAYEDFAQADADMKTGKASELNEFVDRLPAERAWTDTLIAARQKIDAGQRADDALGAQVRNAAAYALVAAQPDAEWTCSLGHKHERPECMSPRSLADQAERLRNEGLGRSISTYSGATWSLGIYHLIDRGFLATPGVQFEIDVTEAGRVI